MTTTYEVNANGGRNYTSDSAAKVADVAATWKQQGHEPQAYAILSGDSGVRTVRVEVTKSRATAKALSSVN